MKFLDKLFEEFHKGVKAYGGKYVEIFVNPTKYELQEISDKSRSLAVRWIADYNTKKVYAYDGEVIHWDVAGQLGFKQFEKKSDEMYGVCYSVKGDKKTYFDSDALLSRGWYSDKETLKNFIKRDWSWVNKYLPGFNSWWKTKVVPDIKKRIAEKEYEKK